MTDSLLGLVEVDSLQGPAEADLLPILEVDSQWVDSMAGLVEVYLLQLNLPSDPSAYNPPDAHAYHTDLHITSQSGTNFWIL